MSGGFDGYDYMAQQPVRLERIKEAVRAIGADFIGLVDTFRWDSLYSSAELAEIFGYRSAYCINLEDARLKEKGHNNGITVLTNLKVEKHATINLATRKAIKTSISEGDARLDIFSVYLDDLSEDTRVIQANKLLEYIDPKTPTIVMGDLNTFKRTDLDQLNPLIDKFFQNNPSLRKGYQGVLNDMKRGDAIEILEKHGLRDSSPQTIPTAPSKISPAIVGDPFLRLDYAFVSAGLNTTNFQVVRDPVFGQASDHYPIVFECALS